MLYKSQYGQDRWVVDHIFGEMTHGYFVDIGAGDGETISNTWVFEKELQWEGICIEPCDIAWDVLQKNRQCRLDNVVVSDFDGEQNFHEITSKGYFDFYFSSIRPPLACHPEFVVKKKKAERLYTVLNRLNSSTLIHFMSIDTEGMELTILRKFFEDEYVTDQAGWKRRIIALTVEHNGNDVYRTQINNLMEQNLYTRVASLGVDDVYVHKLYEGMVK